ncbi:hypothetical protein GWI33_016745 [Rhynchophorus ferrugineus]|uniref:Uncharacterized protein n=1 Tax=Rhynchophorus ferrugineus TaxID=354439 RepID=A0A834I326_RHYFE|nr:hypothetical protein GWI33_016745 [Rhynchophorus ferrugineus]
MSLQTKNIGRRSSSLNVCSVKYADIETVLSLTETNGAGHLRGMPRKQQGHGSEFGQAVGDKTMTGGIAVVSHCGF